MKCVGNQLLRTGDVAFVKGFDTLMQDGFRFALLFGLGTSCAFNVGTGSTVMTIEKEHAGPQVDGLLVMTGEILIEA